MTACVKCGAQLADGSRFCNFCGNPQFMEPLPAVRPDLMSSPNTVDKRYAKVKGLILTPIIVFVVIVVCFVIALLMDVPMSSTNVIYRFCITIAILGGVLSPLPCLVITIMGTVLAARAMKEGLRQCRVFFVVGVIEIIATIAITVLGAAILSYIGYLV